jgi:hypothetical protein
VSLRPGRRDRRTFLWLLGALAVLLLPMTFPVAAASFTAGTADGGNGVTAGTLDPPSNLVVTQSCPAVAAPVFRSATGASGTNSVYLTTPVGAVAGDVLLAHVSNRDNWPLPAPAGWTLVRRDDNGPQLQAAVFRRVVTASEPAGVTFTLTGSSSSQIVGGIIAYGGVSTTSPVHASGATTGTGTTATTPSVTTTVRNTYLVHIVAKVQEALPAPTGTTSRGSLLAGLGGLGVAAGDETFGGPGATTARSATSGTAFSSAWVAHTVALRPPAGPPSASLAWTASSTVEATGYRLERVVGGAVEATATVTPGSATAASDGPLVVGTAYSYRLRASLGSWNTTAATATLTPSSC